MTLMVLAPQLLAQWFAGREMGFAMGVFHTGFPLGTILSLNVLSLAGESLGWRASVWLSAGLPLVALIIFVLFFTPAPRRSEKTTPQSEGFFRSIRLAGISIWIVGAAWMLFNAEAISLFTFTPDFLKTTGFSIASAGFVTSAAMWPGLVMNPVIGYVVDKIDHKRAIIIIGGLTVAMLVLLIPTATGWMLALLLLVGAAQAVIPTPLFALAPEVTSPERLGLGFGIIATCLNLGIVVGPVATGLIRDIAGSYQASYVLMAGFSFMVALSMVFLRRRKSQIPVVTRSS